MGENLNLFSDDWQLSKLLLDETPLQVLPSLACAIGLKDAIVLQQLHWKLRDKARRKRPKRMNRYWVYNSYEDWQREEFSFLTLRDVERVFQRLEKPREFNGKVIARLVLSEQFEKRERDRRKWYSINYEALKELEKQMAKNDSDGDSNEDSGSSNDSSDDAKLARSDAAKMADSEDANLADSEDTKMARSEDANLASSNTTKNSYKELPKDTHTQESGSVSVCSKFSLLEIKEYIRICIAEGQQIHSPDALAAKLHETGSADPLIGAKLYPKQFEETQKEKFGEPRKFSSDPCKVCFGAKMESVPGKGARPCPHCVDERGARRGLEPINESESEGNDEIPD